MAMQGERHTCGGVFEPTVVTIQRQVGELLFIFHVEGLRCSGCGEEFITRDTAVWLDQAEKQALARKSVEPAWGDIWTLNMPSIVFTPSHLSTDSQETHQIEETRDTSVAA